MFNVVCSNLDEMVQLVILWMVHQVVPLKRRYYMSFVALYYENCFPKVTLFTSRKTQISKQLPRFLFPAEDCDVVYDINGTWRGKTMLHLREGSLRSGGTIIYCTNELASLDMEEEMHGATFLGESDIDYVDHFNLSAAKSEFRRQGILLHVTKAPCLCNTLETKRRVIYNAAISVQPTLCSIFRLDYGIQLGFVEV